jgi:hypothetical protein
LPPSKISSPNGSNPTIPSADYAQLLKTLCLVEQMLKAAGSVCPTPGRRSAPIATHNWGLMAKPLSLVISSIWDTEMG